MNLSKTKILNNQNTIYNLKIDNEKIDGVESVIYLSQKISFKDSLEEEIECRTILAWNKFWALKLILKGPFSLTSKREICNTCLISSDWHLSKKMERKIRTTQNSIERSILNIRRKDHFKMSTIESKLKNNCAVQLIKNNWGGDT